MGYVDVYETEETGEQRRLCRLAYSGGSIHIVGSRTVGRLILERELNEERPLNWQNGERFLMALHRHYTGTRLRASEYLKGSKDVTFLGEKFNPHHDHLGRFATHGGVGGMAPDTGGGGGGVSSNQSVTINLNGFSINQIRKAVDNKLQLDDLGGLVGAQPGAVVTVKSVSKDRVYVLVDHPDYTCTRSLYSDSIYNEWFAAKQTGTGIGTTVFADQVNHASKFGMKAISTTAAGSYGSGTNGYYTWPRLGYDAVLSDVFNDDYVSDIRKVAPKAKKVSDVLKTKEGRDFWKKEGFGFEATFDLKEGSQSRRILDEYVKERASRESPKSFGGGRGDSRRDLGSNWEGRG